jgi:actin-related protein 9
LLRGLAKGPIGSWRRSYSQSQSLSQSTHRYHHHYHHRSNDHHNLTTPIMSNAAGKWREEQILIICPGSRTTMAQLGCSELTPPTHRIPTRMFKDGDEWRPYYTYKRSKVVDGIEQEEWVEDVDSDEGAVYPLQGMLDASTAASDVPFGSQRKLCR